MSSCGRCSRVVGRRTGLQCETCRRWFHTKCAESDEALRDSPSKTSEDWICRDCRSAARDINPRKSVGPTQAVSLGSGITLESVYDMVRDMRSEMRSKNGELLDSVDFCSGRISDFERVLKELNEKIKVIDKLTAENASLRDRVADLSSRVDDLEQYSRRNNLEIQGVPQRDNENLLDVLDAVAAHVGCDISRADVDAIHRVPHFDRSNSTPKSIVVRFCRRLGRDSLLAACSRKRKSMPSGSSPGLRIDGVSDRCFVNEHLTSSNKLLLSRAKSTGKGKGYRFIWTRDCKIFVRKSEGSHVLQIRSDKDLARM